MVTIRSTHKKSLVLFTALEILEWTAQYFGILVPLCVKMGSGRPVGTMLFVGNE